MDETKKHINTITVYTDGSCMKKKDGTKCGYGILYPNGELPNVSRPLKNGALTNNRAELQAIYVALLQIQDKFTFDKIMIYSDSEYCIKSLTQYINKWVKNGWLTVNNKPVENQDIIKPIYSLIQKYREKIIFVHIRAHTGGKDIESVNNDLVDRLAKNGALQS